MFQFIRNHSVYFFSFNQVRSFLWIRFWKMLYNKLVVPPLRPHLMSLYHESHDALTLNIDCDSWHKMEPFSQLPEYINEKLVDVVTNCGQTLSEFVNEFHDSSFKKLQLLLSTSSRIIEIVSTKSRQNKIAK